MIGGIYSDQKCSLCGSRFIDNKKDALVCPVHPGQKADKFRVYFKGVTKRFGSYLEASRFLTGLRFETDNGKFDPREYKRSKPLGFENLANQWLLLKEKEVKKSSYRKIGEHIYKACKHWGNINVTEIGFKEIQLFVHSLEWLSDKSKHNHLSSVKQFFRWLKRAKVIKEIPEFPEIHFELTWRKTIDKETQRAIIEEIRRISYKINPKIWLGIKWLATYFNMRPGEMINIQEKHIDLKQREILIPDPKERRPKIVYLLDEDVEILKSFPRGLPDLYFFRHTSRRGVKGGQRFGKDLIYTWWKKACKNLDIEGVDLYGGTRHSTVRDLRRCRTPEEIKLASMHSTNKAFERYFTVEPDDIRRIYRDTNGKKLAKDFAGGEESN